MEEKCSSCHGTRENKGKAEVFIDLLYLGPTKMVPCPNPFHPENDLSLKTDR